MGMHSHTQINVPVNIHMRKMTTGTKIHTTRASNEASAHIGKDTTVAWAPLVGAPMARPCNDKYFEDLRDSGRDSMQD